MSPRPWRTNAHARIADFARGRALADADIEMLFQFARRLAIDPFDVGADRDQVGESFCRLGRSATDPSRDLAAGYRIDEAHRTVDVISFQMVPTRR